MENLFQEVVFWVLAVITVGAALAVVHTRDMFRATLALVVSFLGVAGIFVLLNAEFIAVVQVLVYAGGVSVLVIFAVMVTRDVPEGNRNTRVQPLALVSAAGLLLALIYAVVKAQWTVLPDDLPGPVAAALVDSPAQLGQLLLNEFVLPFEIAGIVLLAAVVGALGLVRER
jgi:NADH-quinone oxidoreductase subunit J